MLETQGTTSRFLSDELKKLRDLLKKKEEQEKTVSRLLEEEKQLASEYGRRLWKYDREHFEKYIVDKIGEPPVKPSKVMYIVYPIYANKKKEYDHLLEQYSQKKDITRLQYEEENKIIREKLRLEDEQELEQKKAVILSQKKQAATILQDVEFAIANSNIVSGDMKKISVLDCLIEYLDNGRADSLKEALNIYYLDLERKKLEEKIAELSKQISELSNTTSIKLAELEMRTDKLDKAVDEISTTVGAMSLSRGESLE